MDKLLHLLSENSTFSVSELASMLGEPEEYIAAQIREYENQGIIRGYRAVVNWDEVPGSGVLALIELKVAPQKQKGFDEIAERIMEFEEVESVYLMAGSYDLLLSVKGDTIQDVSAFVSKKLSALEGILATATHFMLRRYKENGISLFDTESEKDRREMGI
ncbi:MAG: Lrp/AsnC family transcriptional regulator [Ruminococcus sp.]|nr:Lrp/AsnC family transcriptional regulator [Ruminococcus sp.]